MHTLVLISVYLHILAAVVWMGGMFFLVLVVVPWLRGSGRTNAGVFLRETGERFRNVGWACFAVLVATGTFQLHARGIRPATFADPGFLGSGLGRVVLLKLVLVVVVIATSAVHDFVVGPHATRAITADPTSAEASRLRTTASRLGRLNALLSLILVALAVMIVRGVPG